MAKRGGPRNARPAKKTASTDASTKKEVEIQAKKLIDIDLKEHIRPPEEAGKLNYITDIVKWYRNYFYFYSTYACPDANGSSPSFEAKFARMEYLGMNRFALSFMRHTGEWVGIYDSLSLNECMKAIRDDSWFVP